MSESDKSGKPELSDSLREIMGYIVECVNDNGEVDAKYVWNSLSAIASKADAAQARIAELETLRKTVEMLTSGLPVTNALDVKFIAEQAVRIKELEYENDLMKEELRSQSQRVKSWYSDKVRDILGLFQQPYRGAGFPIKPPKP